MADNNFEAELDSIEILLAKIDKKVDLEWVAYLTVLSGRIVDIDVVHYLTAYKEGRRKRSSGVVMANLIKIMNCGLSPDIYVPIQKKVLYYLQHCKVQNILEISENCSVFCKYAVTTDDQQLWVMILKTLLYAYEKKTFSFIKYPQLALAAHYLNSRLVTNDLQLNCEELHFLFIFIPSYILSHYFDIFSHMLVETKNFYADFFSTSCENPSRFSNWFLAGMYYFIHDCHNPSNYQPLVSLLNSLPTHFVAFHGLTHEDIHTFVSIVKKVPTLGKGVLSLLVEPALTEVMIRLVVVSPPVTVEEYWKLILEKHPKDSKSIINTTLERMFEMKMTNNSFIILQNYPDYSDVVLKQLLNHPDQYKALNNITKTSDKFMVACLRCLFYNTELATTNPSEWENLVQQCKQRIFGEVKRSSTNAILLCQYVMNIFFDYLANFDVLKTTTPLSTEDIMKARIELDPILVRFLQGIMDKVSFSQKTHPLSDLWTSCLNTMVVTQAYENEYLLKTPCYQDVSIITPILQFQSIRTLMNMAVCIECKDCLEWYKYIITTVLRMVMETRFKCSEEEKKKLTDVTKEIIYITSKMRSEYKNLEKLCRLVNKCGYQMIVALLRSMMMLTIAVEKDNVTMEFYHSIISMILVEATFDVPSNVEFIKVIRQLV